MYVDMCVDLTDKDTVEAKVEPGSSWWVTWVSGPAY